MRRSGARSVLLASVLLASAVRAQDTTTLNGERAIRFLAGHGHLSNYCEGQITLTPTRVLFDSLTSPRHSFEFKRAEIQDLHYGSVFGFHYIKMSAGGKTWRLALYPDMARSFGDRFAFFLRAYRDFDATYAEVKRVEAGRKPPSGVRLREGQDGPVLEFPVLVGMSVLWFEGPRRETVWNGPEAGAAAYERIQLANGDDAYEDGRWRDVAYGTLEVTAQHVRFYHEGDVNIVIDEDKSQMRLNLAVGGYPRVVANFRRTGRVSLIAGKVHAGSIEMYDAAPLVRALGPEFDAVVQEVRASVLPK